MGMRHTQIEGSGLALVLAIAGIGMGILGIALPVDRLKFQNGSFLMSFITNSTIVCGQTTIGVALGFTCLESKFIRFPKQFSTKPYVQIQPNFTQTVQVHDYRYPFISNGVQTVWSAMPNAQTELFGDLLQQHQLIYEGNNEGEHICGLFVNVVVAGTATAFLRIQQSFDQVVWNSFLPNAGSTGSDVPISTVGINFGADGSAFYLSTTLPGPFLRIMGYGGNGIVSPSFTQIYLDCSDYQPTVFSTVTNITSIGFTGNVFLDMPIDNSRGYTFLWSAFACSDNTQAC